MVYLIPDKRMNEVVSHLPEVRAEVHSEAEQVGGRAEARLAAHRHAGQAKVTVTQGEIDSFVNLDDPNALSIEFGHWVGGKFEDPENPKFVGGLYIITGAAGLSAVQKSGPRRKRR